MQVPRWSLSRDTETKLTRILRCGASPASVAFMEDHPVPAWHDIEGRLVLVQLRQPYVVVTHPCEPMIRTEHGALPMSAVRPEHGIQGAATVPYLRGTLHVAPGEPGRIMFRIRVDMDNGAKADVFLDREDVVFITATERSLIQGAS